jgi:hypothetical protein
MVCHISIGSNGKLDATSCSLVLSCFSEKCAAINIVVQTIFWVLAVEVMWHCRVGDHFGIDFHGW